MGQLFPSSLPAGELAPGTAREVETLDLLKRRLPSSYAVFHGVHWTRAWTADTAFGEADFIIVNGTGECLVVEQKSGALTEGNEGLSKAYDGRSKSVTSQL